MERNNVSAKMKYQVWATNRYGDGAVQDLGSYDDPTEIEVKVGMFADDVIITIEEKTDD